MSSDIHQCTLIVTPTSLLAQWAEEIKKHAPSLQVLSYEGWMKIRKDKSINKRESQTRQKGKGKGKTKVEEEEEGEGEDTPMTSETESFPGWADYVSTFDIVLTTFPVLQSELGVARPPVIRPRRATVLSSYSDDLKRIRSPLVTVEWARVIMDEVQLFGGRAAEMMSLIPRVHSLAVSGTPAKGTVGDLLQVIK